MTLFSMNFTIFLAFKVPKDSASIYLKKYSIATTMYLCPFEAFDLISPIISIPHAAKGYGDDKLFKIVGGR